MKTKLISFRVSLEEEQYLLKKTSEIGDYFKPNGGINLSKYIRDCLLQHETHIVKIDGIEIMSEYEFQLKKIGRNFNQILNQINIERQNYKVRGETSEAIITKYNTLQSQFSILNTNINKALGYLDELTSTKNKKI